MAAEPIPEGYTSITPYLTVDDGRGAIEFYKRAFGAEEISAMEAPDGAIVHAELQIGDAKIMLSDKFPQSACHTPNELGGTTVAIFHFADDVDRVVRSAAEAGAEVLMQPENQFWGDRLASIKDPYGNVWQIATRIEELTPEEVEARGREFIASMA